LVFPFLVLADFGGNKLIGIVGLMIGLMFYPILGAIPGFLFEKNKTQIPEQ